MTNADSARLAGLDFDEFRRLATDERLSDHERVGFPDAYREGREAAILADIASKLPALDVGRAQAGQVVVDIGCGCGPLASAIQRRALDAGQQMVLVDSVEMLDRNSDAGGVEKVAGQFPLVGERLAHRRGACAAVLAYSVLQYTLLAPGVFEFVDAACELLAPGGRLLLADVPNASMRKRFLTSEAGLRYHREHSGVAGPPQVEFNVPVRGEIDDAVVFAILGRARGAGLHAWLVPQAPELPMANRREDILIARP